MYIIFYASTIVKIFQFIYFFIYDYTIIVFTLMHNEFCCGNISFVPFNWDRLHQSYHRTYEMNNCASPTLQIHYARKSIKYYRTKKLKIVRPVTTDNCYRTYKCTRIYKCVQAVTIYSYTFKQLFIRLQQDKSYSMIGFSASVIFCACRSVIRKVSSVIKHSKEHFSMKCKVCCFYMNTVLFFIVITYCRYCIVSNVRLFLGKQIFKRNFF